MARSNKAKDDRTLTWQSQKSNFTRDRIILATLDCLIEVGYVRTTMARIAAKADVSQGSIQYHFRTKMDLIKAAVVHLHLVRLNDQRQDLENAPPDADPLDYMVDVYWKHLTEPHFIAYQELVMAARTDPDLAAVMRPAYQTFMRMWRQYSREENPEWKEAEKDFDLLSNVGQYLMEGMAFGQLNRQLDDEDVKELLEYTKRRLRNILRGNEAVD